MVFNGSVKVVFVTLQYTQQPFAVFSRKWPRVFDSSTFDTRDPQKYSFVSLKRRQLFTRGVRSASHAGCWAFARVSSDSI